MTAYYVVEEPDDVFPDDFGNDDAPVPQAPTGLALALIFEVPLAPTTLTLTLS